MPGRASWQSLTRPKTFGFELGAQRVQRHFLDRTGLGITSVVDQRADRAVFGFDLSDRVASGGFVGDVEGEHAGARSGEVGDGLGFAGGRPGGQARCHTGARDGVADAGRAAGDQYSGSHGSPLLIIQ
jgi:hypothetical protein